MKKLVQKSTLSRLFTLFMAFSLVVSALALSQTTAYAAEIPNDEVIISNETDSLVTPLASGDIIAEKAGQLKPGERFALTFKVNNLFGKTVTIGAGAVASNGGSGTVTVRFKATQQKINMGPSQVLWTIDLPYGEHTVYIENASTTCTCAVVVVER